MQGHRFLYLANFCHTHRQTCQNFAASGQTNTIHEKILMPCSMQNKIRLRMLIVGCFQLLSSPEF